MALPVGTQAKYWAIATLIFALVLWGLGDVLLPFIMGGAIAYCLDPLADALERRGASRIIATTIISLAAVLLFTILALLVIPLLVGQLTALIEAAPSYVADIRDTLEERLPDLFDEGSTMRSSLTSLGETLQSWGGTVVSSVFASASSIVNGLVIVVLVPVIAFYLLLDWDNMTAKIDDLLPRDHAPTVRKIAAEIDRTLASFIRGQGTVCLILGTFYAVALMVVGLQFGLVVGFIAGLISFIPYVGAIFGGVLALGLALFQWWGVLEVGDGTFATDWTRIAAVAIVFAIGQALEGNVLTPKLVGNSVGLHPVWLIVALSVFGALFGFVGLLVAVPVAAMIGVVARFAIGEYKKSLLYRGIDPE
ncbi:MAG: AI-2E family transporter [Planktomarina sp.]